MNRNLKMIWCALLIVAFSGCLNIDETYTINPDGTGKVVHKAVFPLLDFNLPGQESDPQQRMKSLVKEELEKSAGVEAWTDVSYSLAGTDKINFEGTAYFKDISALKFHNGGTTINLFDRVEIKPQNGQEVLTVSSSGPAEEPEPAEAAAPDLSEEEIAQQIEQIHNDMDKMRVMMAGIFSDVKITRAFRLPGPVIKAMNLQQPADNEVRFSFSGEKLISVMEGFMSDEEWLRLEILAGRSPMKDKPDDDLLNEKFFGQNAPVKAIYDPGDPQFDYEKEVAAARNAQKAILNDLGVIPQRHLEASPGTFRVGAVRLVYFSDMDNEVRPFNYDEGYTLSIVGDLPPGVIKVTGGTLKVARAEQKVNLLPGREWDKKINFPNLSKDKNVTVFEVTLRVPPPAVKSIEELSGELEYIVASGIEEEDLKIKEFKAGAEGNEFGARIEDIKESDWGDGKPQMDLKVNLSPERVKSVRILNEEGRALEVSQGYSSSGEETTYNFTLKEGVFPDAGRIIMEVYQNPEKYTMPFKIENISVCGRPL